MQGDWLLLFGGRAPAGGGLRARVSIAQWEEYICTLVLSSSRLWCVSEASAAAPSARDNRQADRRKDNFVNPVNILSARATDRLNICFASYTITGYCRCCRLKGKSNGVKLLTEHFHFQTRDGGKEGCWFIPGSDPPVLITSFKLPQYGTSAAVPTNTSKLRNRYFVC